LIGQKTGYSSSLTTPQMPDASGEFSFKLSRG
jgi:hypothetical protein